MQLQFHRRKRRVWQGWTVICVIALLVVLAGSANAAGCTNISPLPCSDVLVAFPYQLDFGSDAGKILDGNGVGTGFTMVDPPTNGTGSRAI